MATEGFLRRGSTKVSKMADDAPIFYFFYNLFSMSITDKQNLPLGLFNLYPEKINFKISWNYRLHINFDFVLNNFFLKFVERHNIRR